MCLYTRLTAALSDAGAAVELARTLASQQRSCDDAMVGLEVCRSNLADCHQVGCRQHEWRRQQQHRDSACRDLWTKRHLLREAEKTYDTIRNSTNSIALMLSQSEKNNA